MARDVKRAGLGAAMLWGAIAAALLAAAPAYAGPQGALHAVVNVDLMPSEQEAGTRILADYVAHMRRDPGVTSVTLIQQSEGANHFILEESFASAGDYQRFVQSDAVRAFRVALYPHLGSPWDERLGHELAPR